jgi:Asp-tRNA(Asn)/Glu-tRNA(Gln) amidotransferase A subunit family amidase
MEGLSPSLPQLVAGLESGALGLGDYLDRLEERFARVNPGVDAFLPESERFERLAREATALVERFPDPAARPALFGVPFGVKDIFHVGGFATRAGSRVPVAELAGPEAASVTALRNAGALLMGKTVTTEFAFFAPGPTRNPADLERTPGGSSSGSAAAVAAGLCPLALGTQTIGSISRPASYCGIVGFKPTYGRAPLDGVIPLAPSVDHIGWFAADVAGVQLAAATLCSDWRSAPAPVPRTARARLAVPESPYLACAGRAARERFRRACEALVRRGFEIFSVPVMGDFEAIETRHRTLVAAEAARVHSPWYERFGHTYHEKTRDLIEAGLEISDEALALARTGCAALRAELTAAMETRDIDLWLSPASPGVAPVGLESTGDPVMNLPWTHAGLPSVSLPLPRAGNELPFGLQVVGRWQEDENVLGWAEVLESELAR